MTEFFLYLGAGRLLVWVLQINGLMKPVWASHPLLKELSGCDLCLGFWVYLILGFFPTLSFGFGWWWPVDLVILATTASFMAHLLRLGWGTRFGVVIDD